VKVVCTIEARMRSNRLPNKVMLPVAGTPMLARMIERLRRAKRVDEIVVATTADPSCDPIVELAKSVGVRCHRGSEDDVLSRVLEAAQGAGGDLIVETTGDCPLMDPAIIDRIVEEFLRGGCDYCSNVLERTYPRGMDVQVFPTSVLARVAELTQDPADREHVSLYIYQHPETFRLRDVTTTLPAGAADLRLTVDTPEDFELIRQVFERLLPAKPAFTLDDVLALWKEQPALFEINRKVQQKAVR
jgi:spore coat polysaccharide biosynthesis protein SpsF